jgi:hypothetical protein
MPILKYIIIFAWREFGGRGQYRRQASCLVMTQSRYLKNQSQIIFSTFAMRKYSWSCDLAAQQRFKDLLDMTITKHKIIVQVTNSTYLLCSRLMWFEMTKNASFNKINCRHIFKLTNFKFSLQ